MKIKCVMGAFGLAALVAMPTAASAQWTGCGFGVGGSILFAEASAGGPVGLGANGQKAGGTFNCDYKMQAFVAGAEVNYDWTFGDIETLGVKNDFSVMGRLGVLTSPANLLYVGAGWGQTDVGPKIDSWRIALGDEFRIPNSPMYLDLRMTYIRYDESDVGLPGSVKLESFEGGARLKFKFGPGMFGNSGPIFESATHEEVKPCDPKIPPGCRR
jgi:hypothetical protein